MRVRWAFLAGWGAAMALGLVSLVLSHDPFPGLEYLKMAFPLLLLTLDLLNSHRTDREGLSQMLYRGGLLLCAVGDYFLGRTPAWFEPGMAAFGLAYLAIAASLLPVRSWPGPLAFFAVLTAGQALLLPPLTGPWAVAVGAYAAVILAMAAFGWACWLDKRRGNHALIAVGVTLLYASDSMIAHAHFGGLPMNLTLVLGTYVAAQGLVFLGRNPP